MAEKKRKKRPGEDSPALLRPRRSYKIVRQYTSAKVFSKVLPFAHDGGPFWTRTRDPGLIRTVL